MLIQSIAPRYIYKYAKQTYSPLDQDIVREMWVLGNLKEQMHLADEENAERLKEKGVSRPERLAPLIEEDEPGADTSMETKKGSGSAKWSSGADQELVDVELSELPTSHIVPVESMPIPISPARPGHGRSQTQLSYYSASDIP